MSELTFRIGAKASDRETVKEIMISSGFFEEVSDEIESSLEDFDEAVQSGTTTYVCAELDGKLVGYISFDKLACTDNVAMFEWLAVDNKLRGMGIGKKIMETAFAVLRERGYRKAFLYTSGRPQYLPTRKFYEKCGFTLEGQLKDYYVVGDPCFVYSIIP